MTKSEKKEIFLHILENWFNDKTGEINSDNCVKFYHYFLDNLEFEVKFCPENGPGFHKFLSTIIDILTRFDEILIKNHNKDYILQGQDGLLRLSSHFSGISNQDKLEHFLFILGSLYAMSKEEFLL